MAETLPALPVDLSDLAARAAEFARSSRSAATERAYRSDWADFAGWCVPASPATTLIFRNCPLKKGEPHGPDIEGYRGHQVWPESGSLPRFLIVFEVR